MLFEVLLTEDAARDLEEIYDYIAEHDATARRRISVPSNVAVPRSSLRALENSLTDFLRA